MRRAIARLAIIFVGAASGGLIGCGHDMWTFEPPADSLPLDSIIALSRANTGALHADTVSMDTLTARLPLNATLRDVDFTTTAGYFDQTGRAKEVRIRAIRAADTSHYLIARVVFRTDTLKTGGEVDTANVRAAISDFVALVRIPLVR